MIIQRNTFITKPGCLDDAVELAKAEINRENINARVMYPLFGPFDQGAVDFLFHDLAELDMFWKAYLSSEAAAKFLAQWSELITIGGKQEVWQVVAPENPGGIGTMINRRQFNVIPGKVEDVVKLILSVMPADQPYILTTSTFGPTDVVEMDLGFMDMAAYDRSWAEFSQSEAAQPFFNEWPGNIMPGGSNELWQVM